MRISAAFDKIPRLSHGCGRLKRALTYRCLFFQIRAPLLPPLNLPVKLPEQAAPHREFSIS
jgi:hypothetical protein